MKYPFLLGIACGAIFLTAPAYATYHTFRIDEIYSNPSGTVQFIEFHESSGFNGQQFVTLAPDVKSSTSDFTFSTNLPSSSTANKYFLLATTGFEALPGAPTADYVIPSGFFNPAGDTLQYGSTGPDGIVDFTAFNGLPSDPMQAFSRVGTSGSSFTISTAIAHTFNGTAYTVVPEPSTAGLFAIHALAFLGITRLIRRRR